jgi:drug/metabolite transporter superfamily protein YnfA
MTEEKTDAKTRPLGKFWTMFVMLVAALFSFGGPYLSYLLIHFEMNYAFSMMSGLALFIVGLALLGYLIKKKVIS